MIHEVKETCISFFVRQCYRYIKEIRKGMLNVFHVLAEKLFFIMKFLLSAVEIHYPQLASNKKLKKLNLLHIVNVIVIVNWNIINNCLPINPPPNLVIIISYVYPILFITDEFQHCDVCDTMLFCRKTTFQSKLRNNHSLWPWYRWECNGEQIYCYWTKINSLSREHWRDVI